MADIHQHRILILDFGSQYTQLIARRIREIGVYCEIHGFDHSPQLIRDFGPNGIILSGGPESTIAADAPRIPAVVFDLAVPVLGICYGMQAMAEQLGGSVVNSGHSEFGYAEIQLKNNCSLFDGIHDRIRPVSKDGPDSGPDSGSDSGSDSGAASDTSTGQISELDVWMSHGDRVEEMPEGFVNVAGTASAPIAAMANEDLQLYGIQFHPEVTHTKQGQQLLDRFVSVICKCESLWTAGNIATDAIARVQEQVQDDEVILALSGGVDSSVVAALLHRAIGSKLICVFVDNGLLRLNEGDAVMKTFADSLGVRVIRVNAQSRFLTALAGITDPEDKRRVIGNLFVDIFEEEAAKLSSARWLAQGTIYPDVIESAGASTGKAHLIKSHHNVGGLPVNMALKLVEPLRELFKDEVRRLGIELGLPADMVYRHPFPGPGLGVRILGEVNSEYADILRQADDIFIRGLREHELYNKVSQAFAVFLPVKSVGVTGDGRRYNYVIALRAVETIDFMTARAAHLPYDFLDEMSRTIINTIPSISRVTYDISSKPPATIEWE